MTSSRGIAPLPLLLIGLAVLVALLPTSTSVQAQTNNDATGRPVILSPVDEAGVLYAHTLDIADADGIPFSGASDTFNVFNKYTYRWIRVGGGTETDIGADSPRYRLVDADIGKLIKVEVSFEDHAGNAERVTSLPFGPITEPAPLPSPTTLVGNTGRSASATATADITEEYAMGFTLGDHGQGYEIASVSIDLAAAPTDLTVSLWMGKHSGSGQGGSRFKLFDFENPSSFHAGLNEFTAPAGAFAYHGVEYFIVLSDFGASLAINETTSNNEDAGGAPGAELADSAGGDTNVLRLAVKGSRRDSGILVSNFAQPGEGDQEIISVGDKCCFKMDVGNADRYLIRGFSWSADDTTTRQGGFRNPFELHEGSSTSVDDGDDTRRLTMYNTRNNEGVAALTAPLGATVAGGSKTYTFLLDLDLGRDGEGNKIERIDAVLTRNVVPAADGEDSPGAAGFDLSAFGDAAYPDAPYATIFGEPLYAMTSNLGKSDNGYASLGGANHKVLSQGFSTGPNEDGYDFLGIGVEIEGSDAGGDPQVPDGPTFVSVAVHAQSGGKPGAKLFDLVSPTEYAPGHSFFEAPPGTHLAPSTTYVLVWRYNGGTWHRLQRTTSDGEDSGSLTRFWVSDSFYRGADLDNLSEDSNSHALQIAVYTNTPPPGNATGRPVILSPVDEAGVLYAHTLDIADEDGIPFSGASDTFNVFNKYTYRWIRVDGDAETHIGADSPRYRLVDADIGKLIKVEVSFADHAGNAERVTSLPFGPITEPAPLPSPTTLVGNTGRSASATATAVITEEYTMEFRLGDHGQGYEISSVSIDLAAAPSDLTVSLWIGEHSSRGQGRRFKLFDFENPSSFQAGLNEFTAPAGAFAYHGVDYFIVLSDFGASLSINETTSNAQDAGGEPGAELADSAGGDSNVLRLAVKGSRRDSGILVSNYAQPGEGDQEIISVGDKCCFKMDVGGADRYLIRGFSWSADDTTTRQGGFRNPFELHEGSSTSVDDGDDTRRLTMYNTRNAAGIAALTAPLGATVAGGSKTYTFLLDLDLGRDGEGNKIERIDAVLTRNIAPAADGEDTPGAAGFDLSAFGDAAYPDAPYATIFGEPLVAMTSNFGQTNNGFHSLGSASTKVASQAFTTGSDEFGYRLQGFGVNIEGSDADGDPQVPDGPTFVSVAVHAQSGGKPGTKLFDLVSPTEYAPGHSFFEAPPGTHLAPSTIYVLVWRHNGGTWHRLQRTTSDGEDSGARAMFWISDSLYRGADLDNLAADPDSNALEIAVYGEVNTGAEVFALSPGVTVSSDALSVNEGGSGSYTVVLDAEPTASVTVDVTGGGGRDGRTCFSDLHRRQLGDRPDGDGARRRGRQHRGRRPDHHSHCGQRQRLRIRGAQRRQRGRDRHRRRRAGGDGVQGHPEPGGGEQRELHGAPRLPAVDPRDGRRHRRGRRDGHPHLPHLQHHQLGHGADGDSARRRGLRHDGRHPDHQTRGGLRQRTGVRRAQHRQRGRDRHRQRRSRGIGVQVDPEGERGGERDIHGSPRLPADGRSDDQRRRRGGRDGRPHLADLQHEHLEHAADRDGEGRRGRRHGGRRPDRHAYGRQQQRPGVRGPQRPQRSRYRHRQRRPGGDGELRTGELHGVRGEQRDGPGAAQHGPPADRRHSADHGEPGRGVRRRLLRRSQQRALPGRGGREVVHVQRRPGQRGRRRGERADRVRDAAGVGDGRRRQRGHRLHRQPRSGRPQPGADGLGHG